mgnify:FL=1
MVYYGGFILIVELRYRQIFRVWAGDGREGKSNQRKSLADKRKTAFLNESFCTIIYTGKTESSGRKE